MDRVQSAKSESTSQRDLRKKSSMFDSVRRIKSGTSSSVFHGSSSNEFDVKRIKKNFENTYKLEPDAKMQLARIEGIAEDVMSDTLSGEDYDPNKTRLLIKKVSDKVLQKVKELGIERYKFVVLVSIGEYKDQGVRLASRCLWDDKRDNWIEALYENSSMWAVTTVYGVYYE